MSRGRRQDPEQQEKTRTALLDAACELLNIKSYKAISIREIATLAGTQSRMISYYFDSKQGLFEAVVKRSADNRRRLIASVSDEVVENSDQLFEILTKRLIDVLLGEPWLLKLFHDQEIAEDSEIKTIILSEFSAISSSGLLRLFTKFQNEGLIRQDLNLKFFVASFMSLMGFPIMAQPLLKHAVGVDLDTVATLEWRQHITELLRRCVE